MKGWGCGWGWGLGYYTRWLFFSKRMEGFFFFVGKNIFWEKTSFLPKRVFFLGLFCKRDFFFYVLFFFSYIKIDFFLNKFFIPRVVTLGGFSETQNASSRARMVSLVGEPIFRQKNPNSGIFIF